MSIRCALLSMLALAACSDAGPRSPHTHHARDAGADANATADPDTDTDAGSDEADEAPPAHGVTSRPGDAGTDAAPSSEPEPEPDASSAADAGADPEPIPPECAEPCDADLAHGRAAICVDDHCQHPCAEGYVDCDTNADNGCEVHVTDDANHCGACDVVCANGLVCSDSECQHPRALHSTAVGGYVSCALRHGGELSCWGDNASGQLGLGDVTTAMFTQLQVLSAPLHFTQVSQGDNHACGIATPSAGGSRDVYCWGRAGAQLGFAATDSCADGHACAATPTAIGLGEVSRVVAGGTFSCAISNDGPRHVLCWGANDQGQLGRGNVSAGSSTPAEVIAADGAALHGALDIALGHVHACARLERGVVCWGDDRIDQLGQAKRKGDAKCSGACSTRAVALPAFADVEVLELDATRDFSCALSASDAGKRVACWGANERGQLGRGTTSTREATAKAIAFINSDNEPLTIGVGGDFACAAVHNGFDQCWGDNRLGQIGYLTDFEYTATPFQVEAYSQTPPPSVGIDLGLGHLCVQDPGVVDPLMRCWGRGTEGQIGVGYDGSVMVPKVEPLCGQCECAICEP